MFALLISDKIGADMVMLAALTACMAGQIITIQEGVAGFANVAVLTVMILFVVAAGIQLTGGLDWYMAKLLGRPKSVQGAQLRLMVPIAFISAFLNNTPVVVVMIPIVQKWCRNLSIPVGQLLVPLSFASILGGTCTLIGTSTNLVVYGLLEDTYPGVYNIGLFSLGQYGVPVAFVGMTYILLFAPFTLPGGLKKDERSLPMDDGNILLGALMTQWSPAAGRTVKRSGLRDTGGIYLVSVYRASTGNVHRAVGPDFVLNVGDILYFTGMVKEFGKFCAENGLEVVTSENDVVARTDYPAAQSALEDEFNESGMAGKQVRFDASVMEESDSKLKMAGGPTSGRMIIDVDVDVMHTSKRRRSILGPETDKLQSINKMTDAIRGYDQTASTEIITGLPKVVVAVDSQSLEDVVIVGINAADKPGLLLSISRGLHSVGLQLHHTEAAVIRDRSVSVWRCEFIEDVRMEPEEMEESIKALLEKEVGAGAALSRGMPVIRVQVTDKSSLAGVSLAGVDFMSRYKAAVMAVSKADGSKVEVLRDLCFAPGDILVLQAKDDSPLLVRPPPDFYDESGTKQRYSAGFFRALTPKISDNTSLFKTVAGKFQRVTSHQNFEDLEANVEEDDNFTVSYINDNNQVMVNAWRDLQVLFHEKEDDDVGNASREYLNAAKVSRNSEHIGKTITQAGLDKLTGLFVVEVERPLSKEEANENTKKTFKASVFDDAGLRDSIEGSIMGSSSIPQRATVVMPEEPLREGDIIWFAGSADAIVDLRKVPGLESTQKEVLEGVMENKFDRRLVQAVVAKQGPLVGRTPAEMHFRTKYGAAVIAVHRNGKRIQDYPGNIKLHSGDVLLLEAGPTFIARNTDNQRSFALISEECRDAVNWEVYITIASAYGIGSALTKSGLASVIADFLVAIGVGIGIGPAGLYGAVYFATFLISNVVTNNAAAALMFPIAIEAANSTPGVDNQTMAYCLMLSASASFMSPFGYQTNLLIFGPGGYKMTDFLKIGTPMQLILWIFTTVILTNPLGVWWPSWIGTFVVFIVSVVILVCPSAVRDLRLKREGKKPEGAND
eukprot:scaffold28949_cov154-Skeletonema_menzelii.AAC.1